MPDRPPTGDQALRSRCCARSRSGRACRNWSVANKARCRLHGGHSTGARTIDGKMRKAEGRDRHLCRLRAEGRRPGPSKGTGGRPRKAALVDPAERLRADTLAALSVGHLKKRSTPMADAPEEERWRFVEQPVPSATNPESTLDAIGRHAARQGARSASTCEFRFPGQASRGPPAGEDRGTAAAGGASGTAPRPSAAAANGSRDVQGYSRSPAQGGRKRALRSHPAMAQRSRAGGQGP
jgi:hypothetical protein